MTGNCRFKWCYQIELTRLWLICVETSGGVQFLVTNDTNSSKNNILLCIIKTLDQHNIIKLKISRHNLQLNERSQLIRWKATLPFRHLENAVQIVQGRIRHQTESPFKPSYQSAFHLRPLRRDLVRQTHITCILKMGNPTQGMPECCMYYALWVQGNRFYSIVYFLDIRRDVKFANTCLVEILAPYLIHFFGINKYNLKLQIFS